MLDNWQRFLYFIFLKPQSRGKTMMKAIKLSAVLAVAALATGCASTSDLEALDARVSSLEGKVSSASADAASAKAAAADSAAKAAEASAAARAAQRAAEETSKKLDNMFKHAKAK
jgi:murein lipoprotein